MKRERFSSRLGFILISAGCAIGLGNVWRFPYVSGKYGGGAFVLLYLVFLVILGLPIMVMEFAVGRGSQASVAVSFDKLEKPGQKWHLMKYAGMGGNYLLMFFYTTIGGWMLYYVYRMATGYFTGKNATEVEHIFSDVTANPTLMIFCMAFIVIVCFGVCALGMQKGVEKITKVMMLSLLILMGILAVKTITLPGGMEGTKFFLKPDFHKMFANGWSEPVFAAMGQAFFTLSIGVGSMAIFGSYISKDHALTGEAITITALDTFVAVMAGIIIFPACFAFGIQPNAGPKLIFITLPNVFNEMSGGRIWGTLFFIFMSFAAMSTIIAIFENLVSFGVDLWGWSRRKTILLNLFVIIIGSLPCIFGYNLLSGFEPLGHETNILDLEDFIMSNNLMPLGSLVYILFCTRRYGWGFDNFLEETNAGKGIRFPKWARLYVAYVLPLIIIGIFIKGYYDMFTK